MDQVRLPDLEVIKRFSIAVRREHADLAEVLDALQSDLAALRSAGGRQARPRAEEPAEPPPTRETQARARKAAVKPRRPAPARKAAKKKTSRGRR